MWLRGFLCGVASALRQAHMGIGDTLLYILLDRRVGKDSSLNGASIPRMLLPCITPLRAHSVSLVVVLESSAYLMLLGDIEATQSRYIPQTA